MTVLPTIAATLLVFIVCLCLGIALAKILLATLRMIDPDAEWRQKPRYTFRKRTRIENHFDVA